MTRPSRELRLSLHGFTAAGRATPDHADTIAVGNDVVDLADPRCVGKSRDDRFLRRVLSVREKARVAAAENPDLDLWTRWAAKEAAFKAITHLTGEPPVFEHAAFETELAVDAGDSRSGGGSHGVVRWRDLRVPVLVTGWPLPEAVHVVAAWPGERVTTSGGGAEGSPAVGHGTDRVPAGEEIPLERFTERECRALHSPASAWVRIRAREALAKAADVAEERVEIVCDQGPAGRMPPRVLMDGEPARWKVSLSHHGGWLAWALTRPQG